MMRTWLGAIALLVLGSVATAEEPVLHEYVPPPGQDPTASARNGQLPPTIRAEDRTLSQPPSTTRRGSDERVIGAPSATRPDRETEVRPDRTTTHDGVLRYTAEFNPSVVPFKRMTALDKVGANYVLSVRDATLRPVSLLAVPTPPDRDPFWGSVLVTVQGERPVPIPSVAPDARIISYTATPPARVSFFRDSADNFWIRSDRAGQLRLVFLTDAPKRYFSPQIPPTVTAAEVPAALRPTIPSRVKDAASKVLARVGVKPGDTLLRQLERLAGYFRSFEAGALPQVTDDAYLDIAFSQKGVCRHRSLAFVVTMQALGVPARYVSNEAHAFTEVFIPRMGWARVDLGGASPQLQVQNAQDKAIHDPGPDPLPRPMRYSNNYSQLTRFVTGVQPGQRIRRRGGGVSLRVYDRSRGVIAADRRGTAHGMERTGDGTDGREPTITDSPDAPVSSAPPGPAKAPTQIALYSATRAVFRGEHVRVWGKVGRPGQPEGRGVGGLRVEIYLSRDGQTADALLGATVTGPDGRFSVGLPVPRGVQVGDYQIVAVTPGDGRHESSLSQ
jgi:hypothetical protein